MSQDGVLLLFNKLGKLLNLTKLELHLGHNCINGMSAIIENSFINLMNLKVVDLDLYESSLDDSDINYLSNALGKCQTLEILNLNL